MIDERTKGRLRLWLRSERAMGLPSVGPMQWPEVAIAQVATTEDFSQIDAPSVRAPRPVTSPASISPAPRVPSPALLHPIEPPPVETTIPAATSGVAFASPALDVETRRVRLAEIDEGEVRGCTKCTLCSTRQQTVFGEGAADARLMFVGEGPGAKEDQTGRPFVGPAGELLNRMIGAMGLKREQVYIANIVKCRAFMPGPPPKDRAPAPEEVASCSPYLERQVEIIRPSAIVTLGLPASQFVLQTKASMSRLRGTWSAWHGIKVMPTWHPSYLLRRERDGDVEPKRQAWSDLQKVMAELGLTAPAKGK